MRISLSLALCFCSVMFGVSANATRARLTALGQDKNGSLFIKDERNIFLNPAQINSYTTRLNLEAGQRDRVTSTDDTDVATTNNQTNDPKAEGGLIYKFGSFTGGAQLGRVSDAAERINNQNSIDTNFFDPQNSVELIFGGNAGMAWGASVHHAHSKSDGSAGDDPNQEARVLTARGGVMADRFQAYGVFDLMHESEVETQTPDVSRKYDGNLSLELGGSFDLSQTSSIGGLLRQTGYDFDDGAAAKGESEQRVLSAAYFHRFRQEENIFVFGSAGLFWLDDKSDYDAAGVPNRKIQQLSLPVGLGLEVKAASWMKLRGSVTQHVLVHQVKTRNATVDNKVENADSTVVTLGTGILFDKFTFDATLEGSGATGNGEVNGVTLLANAGLTYEF